MKIIRFEEINSTNTYAKSLRAMGENVVVTAKRQTGGRGTKGRSFVSNEGGVYLTRLTFYDDLPAANAFQIMSDTSVAVCRTVEKFGLKAEIKWPNDIYVCGKKICGILIENVFSGDKISSSVVGIGLNVNNDLPSELRSIATSMKALGVNIDRDEVEKVLIEETGKHFDIAEYQKRVGFLRRQIILIRGDERIPAYALSVDDGGGLLVDISGQKQRVTSAEVSLHLEN
jgi:BirA family biotin operon repressor/biotin-[acetyl-CoA-carboxylase] ligase